MNQPNATVRDKRGVAAEQRVARAFAAQGYQTVQKPALTPDQMRALGLDTAKKPDLLVENRVWDVYAPVKPGISTVMNGIRQKIDERQTQRVAVDLTGTGLTERDLRAALLAQPVEGLKEVVALTGAGLGRPFRP